MASGWRRPQNKIEKTRAPMWRNDFLARDFSSDMLNFLPSSSPFNNEEQLGHILSISVIVHVFLVIFGRLRPPHTPSPCDRSCNFSERRVPKNDRRTILFKHSTLLPSRSSYEMSYTCCGSHAAVNISDDVTKFALFQKKYFPFLHQRRQMEGRGSEVYISFIMNRRS